MIKPLLTAAVAACLCIGASAQVYVTAPNNYTGIGTQTPTDKLHIRNVDDGAVDGWSGIRFLPATSDATGYKSYHRMVGYRKSGLWLCGSSTGGDFAKSNMWFKDDNIWFGFSDGSSNPETHPLMRIANNPANTDYFTVSVYSLRTGGSTMPVLYPGHKWGLLGKPDRRFNTIFVDTVDAIVIRTATLDASSSVTANSITVNNCKVTGTLTTTQPVITTSDQRMKKNIIDLDSSVSLYSLHPVKYDLKDAEETGQLQQSLSKTTLLSSAAVATVDTAKHATSDSAIVSTVNAKIIPDYPKKKHYGFLAQEVQKIYPNLVYESPDGLLGIDYTGFIPIIIDQLKAQKTTIDKKDQQLAKLQAQLDAQQKQIDALIKAVDKLKK